MSKCPIHSNDLPCRTCAQEQGTEELVVRKFYRDHGMVIASVEDGRISEVRSCQFGDEHDLIGKQPHEVTQFWPHI